MAIQTYTEQLEAVQTAITAVLTGQSYAIADRSLTRADLATLQDREQYLRRMVERESRGGIRVDQIIPS